MISVFLDLALQAGEAINGYFKAGVDTGTKADGSPVTIADQAGEDIILGGLHGRFPEIAVVAEESAAAGKAPTSLGDRFILVDPLDGTKEFVRGDTDFTVNIALIERGVPTLGVVYAPAKRVIYWCDGVQSFKANVDAGVLLNTQPIQVRPRPDVLHIFASRSHNNAQTADFIAAQGAHKVVGAGSSIKFCLVAEGVADMYPRFAPTMQWDTAAGHAVLNGAGGKLTKTDGSPFRYGLFGEDGKMFLNPSFIAYGA